MMEQLYQSLLHLLPGDFREQFGTEMQGVFQQASEEARQRGSIAYGVFAVREIAGLLMEGLAHRTQLPRRVLLVPVWGLGGFLAALLLVFLLPNVYTSIAVLRIAPGSVSDRLVPGADGFGKPNMTALIASTLNRAPLVNIINTLGLYRSERSRVPMEQVLDRMKENVGIIMDEDGRGLMVRFRHTDRHVAQKVCQQLCTRIVDSFQRFQNERTEQTEQFLREQTEAAAVEWQRQRDSFQKADALSKPRLFLDIELAQKEYVSLKEKLSEAVLSRKLQQRQQGPLIELLDSASLPVAPDRGRAPILAAGGLGGAAVGFVLAWLGPLRWRKQPAVAPPGL
jgi:hypothetical protein